MKNKITLNRNYIKKNEINFINKYIQDVYFYYSEMCSYIHEILF